MAGKSGRLATASVAATMTLLLLTMAFLAMTAGFRFYREVHPQETPVHVYYCDDRGCGGPWKREAGK